MILWNNLLINRIPNRQKAVRKFTKSGLQHPGSVVGLEAHRLRVRCIFGPLLKPRNHGSFRMERTLWGLSITNRAEQRQTHDTCTRVRTTYRAVCRAMPLLYTDISGRIALQVHIDCSLWYPTFLRRDFPHERPTTLVCSIRKKKHSIRRESGSDCLNAQNIFT